MSENYRGKGIIPPKPSEAGLAGKGGSMERASIRPTDGCEGCGIASDTKQEKAPALFCAGAVTPSRSAGRFQAERQTLFHGLGSKNNACLAKRAEKSHRCRVSADAIVKKGGF